MGDTITGLVAQWITRLTTDQKIPGSNPGKVVFCLSCLVLFIPMEKKEGKKGEKINGQCGDRTHDLGVISTTL